MPSSVAEGVQVVYTRTVVVPAESSEAMAASLNAKITATLDAGTDTLESVLRRNLGTNVPVIFEETAVASAVSITTTYTPTV